MMGHGHVENVPVMPPTSSEKGRECQVVSLLFIGLRLSGTTNMESDEGSWEAVRLYTKLERMFTARLTVRIIHMLLHPSTVSRAINKNRFVLFIMWGLAIVCRVGRL